MALEKDRADRSILIGIVATILFHLLLVVMSPRFEFEKFSGIHSGISVQNRNTGKSFDFTLDPLTEAEKQQQLTQYVDTNPDAPDNEPDKTSNFSNRNQQTAQLEKAEEIDPLNRPSITNAQDEIINDTAVVTGDLSQPQLGTAAFKESTQTDEIDQLEQKLRMEQVPLNGFDETEGQDADGIATNISKVNRPSTQSPENVEGAPGAVELEGGLVAITSAHTAQPKARPRLTAPRSTVLTNRIAGTTNVGPIGLDARWSEYGEYMNELIEIIQIQWYRILDESRVSPPRGSHVIITFMLNSLGETDIVKVEDADSGKQGVFSCQNAIQARQPYRKWTAQMISVLGTEQQITFAFYYR